MSSLAPMLRAPIVGGTLRGRWWLPTGGGKVFRVLGGTYEPAQTREFELRVGAGDVVMDLGAHTGYYTLLASSLVGASGRVYAFEPHPRNAAYLKHHVRINRCANVEVMEHAAYDRDGTVRFGLGSGTGTSRVADAGAFEVRAMRVDDFVADRGISPTVLKIDVEGAERRVLDGAVTVLREGRPIVFLSTHGPECVEACRAALGPLGYTLRAFGSHGSGGSVEADGDLICFPEEHGGRVEHVQPQTPR